MQAFELAQLTQQQRDSNKLYLEFLKVPDLSMGVYVLPVGGTDPQSPHTEDEVYYVASGKGKIKVANEDRAVQTGSIIYVAKNVEHRFHSIEEKLTVIVFFAPAEYSNSQGKKIMDKILRQWIVQVIKQNETTIRIALRQRAKFEGWLKFELASLAELSGAKSIEVETSFNEEESKKRADISFEYLNQRYDIELKTPNSNWRMAGVANAHRPITKNISGIIEDALKLKSSSSNGLVAFVLFPIAPNDNQWKKYITRISKDSQLTVTTQEHCERVSISLGERDKADLIVCVFAV